MSGFIDRREGPWLELQRRATWVLEHAEQAAPRDVVRDLFREIRVWHYAAAGSHRSWTVFVPGRRAGDSNRIVVREVTWDRGSDWQRFMEAVQDQSGELRAEPSLAIRDADVPPSDLSSLLEIGRKWVIPIIGVEGPIGHDGEKFGIEDYRFFTQVRLEWFGTGPKEWTGLPAWVDQLRHFLEHCVDPYADELQPMVYETSDETEQADT